MRLAHRASQAAVLLLAARAGARSGGSATTARVHSWRRRYSWLYDTQGLAWPWLHATPGWCCAEPHLQVTSQHTYSATRLVLGIPTQPNTRSWVIMGFLLAHTLGQRPSWRPVTVSQQQENSCRQIVAKDRRLWEHKCPTHTVCVTYYGYTLGVYADRHDRGVEATKGRRPIAAAVLLRAWLRLSVVGTVRYALSALPTGNCVFPLPGAS
jgi:hypothetical protein